MKKTLSLVLAFLLLLSVFSGCAKNADGTSKTSETFQASETATGNTTESALAATENESSSVSSDCSEEVPLGSGGSEETSFDKEPIVDESVPEEFRQSKNAIGDMASFLSGEHNGISYDVYRFVNAYLSGNPETIASHISPDSDCLSRYPTGESTYGSMDEVEHFYFEDIRYRYSANKKTERAWAKAVFAVNGQFYDFSLFFDAVKNDINISYWQLSDFYITEKDMDPADLSQDLIQLQDIPFRFFKAYLVGDLEAAKTLVDDPEHEVLNYCKTPKNSSLKETGSYSVNLSDYQYDKSTGIGTACVKIAFFDDPDISVENLHFMGLILLSVDVKDSSGQVIDRVWKINGCAVSPS